MADGPTTEAAAPPESGKPAAARPLVPKPGAVVPAPEPAAASAAPATDDPGSNDSDVDVDAEVDVSESSGPASAASASGTASASGPASGSGPRTPGSGPSTAGRTSQSGPDPLIGRVVNDRFRIVSMLARGGMGKVYRAEQAPLGREVALKVLNPNYSGDNDPEFHKRFFLEASTCSKLTHPNTVTIFDYGRTDDDVYYIAMELLEGRTLHRALREEGPFPAERAVAVARQICRSLREAHGLGVIHRDLKPANVYLVRHGDENDFVKVLDFGLVKNVDDKGEDLTQTGLFMGSPKYMSPEQIRGERADARADIYSLGVMIYEMVMGKVPFDRPNSVNILMAHVHEAPPPFAEINPNVPEMPGLEALVMKCLSKQASDRFDSMEELLGAMKTVVETRSDLGTSGERNAYSTGKHGAVRPSGSGDTLTSLTPSGVVVPPGSVKTGPNVTSTSTTLPAGRDTDAAPPPSRVPMFAALGVAIVVIGGLVWFGSGAGTPATSTAIHPEPTLTGTVPSGSGSHVAPPPSSVAEPAVMRTLVSLRSTPPGATVNVGDQSYGPTPTDVEWTGDDAARGREVNFVFHLAGRRDYSVLRTITSDALEVSATLEALPTDRPFRPRPPRRPEGDDGTSPVGPVKGYKLDPY